MSVPTSPSTTFNPTFYFLSRILSVLTNIVLMFHERSFVFPFDNRTIFRCGIVCCFSICSRCLLSRILRGGRGRFGRAEGCLHVGHLRLFLVDDGFWHQIIFTFFTFVLPKTFSTVIFHALSFIYY